MEEEVIKRLPPHNVEAERAVIGAMMLNADAIMVCSELLTSDEFYQQQYGIIFDALVEMYKDGVGADLVTLQNKLREKEVTPELYSVEYLGELLASVPTSANVKFYAEIVHEKAVLRRLIRVSEQVTKDCYMDSQPLEDILEDTEKSVFDVIQQRGGSEFEPIRDVVLRTLDSIEKAAKQKGNITGLETGFRDLDAKTAGLQKSDLILIAARPAMGKTAFVLNIAEYVALHSNSTIALFSLEMSKEQLVKRMLAMNSMVDSQKIRTGDLEDDDWDKLVGSVRKIGNSNLVIDDTSGITASELRSKCRKLKIEQGLDLVIIDYLQLMTGAGKRKSDSRQQEISDISRSLKVMARELNVPVIALSQLSRAVESRPDKRPMLSDLRESGAIEQDADIVMFIYRDEYYNPDSEKKGVAEVIVAKQRSGPTGPVELAWLSQYTKFGNLEYKR
ncbi:MULTISPECIES: replicative DNA helicase [Clostridia]|uniref:Replicative DNA helicase n=1 Tax=Butyribacter intestini TaxID=1703332 RepID=A0AAW3JRZ6_9FIRM|nr:MULTISPECIES: replicative DNA helicase [Clostridia]KQC85658.1 replicative DNA helicase [Butyribacter intestini]RHP22429.1 replicative DNA helicase [Clostridium sp. AF34-13]RHU76756.1 replicative DNA helicase [Butyribacter intestini]UYJ40796.1 MAG: replicative DNA helicase [Lachnospiraceae bacterium]